MSESRASTPARYLPAEACGEAPARAIMAGRRVLVVGGGQQTYGLPDAPIGIGRATSVLAARGLHRFAAGTEFDVCSAGARLPRV